MRFMRQAFLLAALAICGCEIDLLTSSSSSSSDDHSGGGPTPTPACAAVACDRVPFDSTGAASSFAVRHSCGVVSLTCTGSGSSETFSGVTSGSRMDPAAGAGTYVCVAESGATCVVTLDS